MIYFLFWPLRHLKALCWNHPNNWQGVGDVSYQFLSCPIFQERKVTEWKIKWSMLSFPLKSTGNRPILWMSISAISPCFSLPSPALNDRDIHHPDRSLWHGPRHVYIHGALAPDSGDGTWGWDNEDILKCFMISHIMINLWYFSLILCQIWTE